MEERQIDSNFHSIEGANTPELILQFDGSRLNVETMPIYELGEVLIATQRIVHKAYLDNDSRPFGSKVTRQERKDLALQISSRKKGSDWIELIQSLANYATTDPLGVTVAGTVVSSAILNGVNALWSYEKQNVVEVVQQAPDPQQSIVFNIYGSVESITSQFNRDNGIEGCNIILPNKTDDPNSGDQTVRLDRRTHAYLREIKDASISGAYTEIVGKVKSYNDTDSSISLVTSDRIV
ncbi:MAG: hypothetical protein ACPG8W_08340 [Candidatus Promineifilaceae bacterium]